MLEVLASVLFGQRKRVANGAAVHFDVGVSVYVAVAAAAKHGAAYKAIVDT